MLADATETCSVDIGNKNLTIDLNDKNLTITQISTMNALTIKNGSMSAEIDMQVRAQTWTIKHT
jgi:hypothetical protein